VVLVRPRTTYQVRVVLVRPRKTYQVGWYW